MPSDVESILLSLERALDGLDWGEASRLCAGLERAAAASPVAIDRSVARRALTALRRKRRFAELGRLADALLFAGLDEPFVRLAYAQSLLDRGGLGAGLALLDGLRRERPDDPEIEGLRGRAYKQAYVRAFGLAGGVANEALQGALREAFLAYAGAYERDPGRLWHGVNAVAVARRAERDGVPLGRAFDAGVHARVIRDEAERREREGAATAWHTAIALECAVALGDRDGALRAAARYVLRDDCDAFEYASTLRQLRELWLVDDADPGDRLVTGLLEAKILDRRDGAEVRPAPAAAPLLPAPGLEKAFSSVSFRPLENYRRGLRCAEAVARVHCEDDAAGYGTGFLLRGAALRESFGATPLLLTNAHVLDREGATPRALRPEEASVSFETGPNAGQRFAVKEIVWRSGVDELDTVVVALAGDLEPETVCEPAKRLPAPDVESHVYVIGHPLGAALSYSLQDTLLLDHDGVRLHYRTPTQGGSSGSPVFDRRWGLLGIHHAGVEQATRLRGKPGTYQANEGFALEAIRAQIDKDQGA